MSERTQRSPARFMILAAGGLYEEADVDRICRRHAIRDEALKLELWRVLEDAGRRLVDARRLDESRVTLGRLRQEILLGLRLCDQLETHLPADGQLEEDRAGVSLSRHHLASLREAEGQLARADGPRNFSLEDCVDAVRQLKDIYEVAAERCRAGGRREGDDPADAWRASLRRFYTQRMARAWSFDGEPAGEAFLVDCQAPLARVADAAAEEALVPAQ